jgi:hypothetical protein
MGVKHLMRGGKHTAKNGGWRRRERAREIIMVYKE